MATHNTLFKASDVKLRNGSVVISTQLPWYRSLWLSAVADVGVKLDGVEVPRQDVRFELAGRSYDIDELPQQWDTLWFLQDRAEVVVPWSATTTGAPLRVELTLELRLLYMQIAPGQYVPNRVVVEQQVDPAALLSA